FDPQQIADGVLVFDAIQAAEHGPAFDALSSRITGGDAGIDPLREHGDFLGRRLRLALRRHGVRIDPRLQWLPRRLGLGGLDVTGQVIDPHVAFRFFTGVAFGAVFLQDGADLRVEARFVSWHGWGLCRNGLTLSNRSQRECAANQYEKYQESHR